MVSSSDEVVILSLNVVVGTGRFNRKFDKRCVYKDFVFVIQKEY